MESLVRPIGPLIALLVIALMDLDLLKDRATCP